MGSGAVAYLSVVSHAVVIESSFGSELFLTLLTFEGVPQLQEKTPQFIMSASNIMKSWVLNVTYIYFTYQLYMTCELRKSFVGSLTWKWSKNSLPAPHSNFDNIWLILFGKERERESYQACTLRKKVQKLSLGLYLFKM